MLPRLLRWLSRDARVAKRNPISRRSLALEHLEDRYLLTVIPSPLLPDSIITTVAGADVAGYSGNNGQATAAALDFPRGVAVDAAGDIFIADFVNNCVREVNAATGVITTVAGNHTAGYRGDGGQATAAELHDPTAVAVDASGDLFITDTANQVIRKVNASSGVISTVVGNGTAGFYGDNGPATAAKLNSPTDVVMDGIGNLLIADQGNNRVREVNLATSVITTVAGNGSAAFSGNGGPATAAALNGPTGVAVDSAGDLFIADFFNHQVREVNYSSGVISTVAGTTTAGYSGDDGPATAAEMDYPWNVAVDNCGELFIADYRVNAVREVNLASGVITTAAGDGLAGYAGNTGPATAAYLSEPASVACDAAGNLFIADAGNCVIREVAVGTPTFTLTSPISGTFATGQSITIQWTAGYVETGHTVAVSLGYDADTTLFNANQHWSEVNQVTLANGSGSYVWNTTGLAPGRYYLDGYAYDFATDKASYSYLGTPITIDDFALSGPASGTFAAGQSVSIQWTAADVDAGNTISLAYSTVVAPAFQEEHWIEINQVTAANGAGSYSWNTAGLAAGTYYFNGYMYDSVKTQAVFSFLETPITIANFALSGPSSGTFAAGQSVSIQWAAANVDTAGPTKITLGYDRDATPFDANQSWLEVDGVTAANGAGTYTWNTAGVAAGTYYLSGYMYDFATKQVTYSYLATPITIANFALSGPSSGTFAAGQSVTVQWAAGNVDTAGPTKITLGYDTDATPFDTNQHWIEIDQVTAANGAGSYSWNTTGLAAGTYYLSGYTYNFSTGQAVYANLGTPIVITAYVPATFTLTGPSAGTFAAGQSLTIQWTAANVDLAGPSKISLGYDADATPFDANQSWIEVDHVTAVNGAGSYSWNTTGVAAGTYYLSGYLYDFSVDQALYTDLGTPIVIT